MIEERKYGREKIVLLCGVFLVMTGFGITLPVLPFYIQQLLKLDRISSRARWPFPMHFPLDLVLELYTL